jgi:glycosyltransferase involved in cell wall biosynthesis
MECTIGGTRRHLRDLVHGLLARGVEVEVACAARRDPRMRQDMAAMTAAGARVHELPMVRAIRPLRDSWHTLRLAALVCDRRFDVIHTHSSKAGALGRAAGWLASSAARVHTPHTYAFSFDGGAGQGGESAGPVGLVLASERWLGRITHQVVHVSGSEMAEGRELGASPDGRGRVIHNGIDPTEFAEPSGGPALREELGIPAGAPLVGSIGLLNDAKGFDVLVEAATHLPPATHVLIVGHGEREARLRAQAESLGLAERVHLAGWRDDLHPALDAMDVFALPSRWEGLPYALLEAMAAGLACVSTDVNGSRDILGVEPPCGLLVPRQDPPALAAALVRLLQDERLRTELAGRAPARVAEAFTLEHMVERTLALYGELCGQPAPSRPA